MCRPTTRRTAAVLAGIAVTAVSTATAGGVAAPSDPVAGPPYEFTTELVGQFGEPIPLKNAAMITRTELGYLYRAGQQDGHLVVSPVDGGLRFRDTGTQRFEKLARACRPRKVKVGVAAVCRMPTGATEALPLLVEVWPRLGDDFTDASRLPPTVAVTVLGDEGHDVALLGAGPDFFNGHSGRDRVRGGDGNDWIRAGLGRDRVYGGPGDDRLIGMDGPDTVRGGDGDDRVDGGDGDDVLQGDGGADFIVCGTGIDTATMDLEDFVLSTCESVTAAVS